VIASARLAADLVKNFALRDLCVTLVASKQFRTK
jgi:hypothetical protein